MATRHYLAMDNLITKNPKITALKGKRFVDNGRTITTGVFPLVVMAPYTLLKKCSAKTLQRILQNIWCITGNQRRLMCTLNNDAAHAIQPLQAVCD
ncbi:MAG: hypothetical protein ABI416_15075 [Ginsengibacter sp.]